MKQWQVVVHDDAVNFYAVVVDVLNRVGGLSYDNAIEAAKRIQETGMVAISSTSQHAAELTAVRLRGYGLDATIAWSKS
ncbi:ATP-dependent Clp protease adaptor ClpS [Kutzneria buriramensis]|uniref:ATP-dependent Clp protease adaptor protein ClpS n=1 Tax=Kutzneria buriramensis TaxID=1045776 RepID=A0A3E0H558_9PSEU|nr:ATP-dependent Clp protease adaptor ClpS [Kutzneria buriramensis]REH38241.1 ATP-dependent Clp protease adaptor protein ClpS [Kutzneria buriramensis]